MKERITYIIRDPTIGFDPSSNLNITTSSLAVKALDGAKEYQITLGLDEVPSAIRDVLTRTHEVHGRWAVSREYEALAPFVSRVAAGLHVFMSPLGKGEGEGPELCPLLKGLVGEGVKCDDVERSFTTLPLLAGRFSHAASRQWYEYVPSIHPLVQYLVHDVCGDTGDACKIKAQELLLADYIDADYDSLSHTLSLKVFWSKARSKNGKWNEVHNRSPNGALEVGVLINEKPDEKEELRYSGFLTQVGKDTESSPTLFSFPSRHHPLHPSSSSFTTTFRHPTGLHPTLQLTIPNSALATPPQPSCHLHTYLTLPSSLFVDRYPLSDPLTLSSHSLTALHSLTGATDLEAPDYMTPQWGSAALFEIKTSPPTTTTTKGDLNVTIPLHLRYLTPNNHGSQTIHVPNPVLFWACPAEEGGLFPSSPFDRVNLGYEALFGPKTMFYHFTPSAVGGPGEEMVQKVEVPVLALEGSGYVEWGTVFAVVAGAVLVAWPLVRVVVREFGARLGQVGEEEEKKEKEKKRK